MSMVTYIGLNFGIKLNEDYSEDEVNTENIEKNIDKLRDLYQIGTNEVESTWDKLMNYLEYDEKGER